MAEERLSQGAIGDEMTTFLMRYVRHEHVVEATEELIRIGELCSDFGALQAFESMAEQFGVSKQRAKEVFLEEMEARDG